MIGQRDTNHPILLEPAVIRGLPAALAVVPEDRREWPSCMLRSKETVMPENRKETDVKVSCQRCGKAIGYIVKDGHKDWLCETCGDGKFTPVMEGVTS